MGLELRRDENQVLRSKWWYGRYTANGKRNFINLGIEVRGTPPENLRHEGDMAFECSRTLASAKLNELIRSVNNQKSAESRSKPSALVQIRKLRTGLNDELCISERKGL